MVNPGKRMRKLQPLLDIRMGPGAVLLPPPPAAQLTSLRLRLGNKGVVQPRRLWRNHFQQLKYHNPALPITVERFEGPDGRLTLHFEGEDSEVLNRIPGRVSHKSVKSPKGQGDMFEELAAEESEIAARQQSPNWRDAPSKDGSVPKSVAAVNASQGSLEGDGSPNSGSTQIPSAPSAGLEPSATIDAENAELASDEVTVKPQPAADPSSPSSTKPPRAMHMRTIEMGLRGHTVDEIWAFFQQRTMAQKVPDSKEDIEERQKLDEFFAKAELDRQRVKAGMDAVRKEKEDLRRARGEAEALAAAV